MCRIADQILLTFSIPPAGPPYKKTFEGVYTVFSPHHPRPSSSPRGVGRPLASGNFEVVVVGVCDGTVAELDREEAGRVMDSNKTTLIEFFPLLVKETPGQGFMVARPRASIGTPSVKSGSRLLHTFVMCIVDYKISD